MRAQLTFSIEASSNQKVTALREGAAAWLEENEAKVINRQSAPFTNDFIVEGVDTKSRATFKKTVKAIDVEEAKAQVEAPTMVVTSARPLLLQEDSQGD